MNRHLLFICVISASFGFASAVQAQDKRAAELERLGIDLEQARAAYERGDFATARDALKRVYAVYPDAKVLYRLALCHEKLGEDAEAIKAYQEYLIKVPDDPERAKIEGLIRTLQERSAPKTAKLRIQTQPADATLLIDGAERLERPDEGGERLIELAPGEHVIKLSRDGYISQERKIEVTPAERYNMVIGLQAIRVERDPWLAWTLTGVGGAALVAGTFFLGRAHGGGETLTAIYDGRAGGARPSGFTEQAQAQNRDVALGWSLVGAGLIATGVGVALFLWEDEPDQAPVRATLTPALGPDGLGAGLTLEF